MRDRIQFLALACCTGGALLLASPAMGQSAVNFQVDPALFDADEDGFITGTEFSPFGSVGGESDGVQWVFEPVNNLVGTPRLFLSPERGMQFGGGGGSSLAIDFTPSHEIQLLSYNITNTNFILNNPAFEIRLGDTVLSGGNEANTHGTFEFAGGSILLLPGETYRFQVTTSGAAVQSFFSAWNYTIVPAPSVWVLGVLGASMVFGRRRPA